MRAGAAIGIASGKIVRQKASPGIGDAHGSVHKRFDLQAVRDMLPDLPDLPEAQFSSADNPLRSEIMPEAEGFIVDIVCLRRNMNRHLRADAPCAHEDAGISDQKRVRPDTPEEAQVRIRFLQILIVRQDIHGYINLYPVFMRVKNGLLHLLFREVLRLRAQGKCLSPDIDRVRSIVHGHLQCFKPGRRDQQFRQCS